MVDVGSLLYQEHEKMLVNRGKLEGDLMAHHTTAIAANVVKGVGGGGGFASSKKVSPKQLKDEGKAHAKVLRQQGVVRIDHVLSHDLADNIRDFVFDLRKESEQAVQSGSIKLTERFAEVLLKENRCDLTLPLATATGITGDALVALLQQSAIGETIKSLLGKDAVLYELSCLISDPGSHRQVMHPDTPCASNDEEPVLYTCFVALQDITVDMGPTTWMPGTHTLEAHELFQNEATKDALLEKGPAVLGLLPKGSCGIFDSRLLHCGGANVSHLTGGGDDNNRGTQRAVFYFSFRNPNVPNAGNPGSIRPNLINQWTLAGLDKELKQFSKSRNKSEIFLT